MAALSTLPDASAAAHSRQSCYSRSLRRAATMDSVDAPSRTSRPTNHKEFIMKDIIHRIGIRAPAAEVYAALATIPGLDTMTSSSEQGRPSTSAAYSADASRKKIASDQPSQMDW